MNAGRAAGKENRHDKALNHIRGAGLALMLGTASGSASVLITIEQDGFGSGPIKVISEDGQKWTKILDGDLTLPVKIYLGISNGWFVTYHIKQASGTLIAYGGKSTREWWQETLRCDQAHGGNRGNDHRQCLQRPPEFRRWISQKQTFWHAVELELVGRFAMNNGDNYPPYSGPACLANSSPIRRGRPMRTMGNPMRRKPTRVRHQSLG